jgi:hypothetical protein
MQRRAWAKYAATQDGILAFLRKAVDRESSALRIKLGAKANKW